MTAGLIQLRIQDAPQNRSGLCECGCGYETAISTGTDYSKGRVKGKPNRFVVGHSSRRPVPAPIPTIGGFYLIPLQGKIAAGRYALVDAEDVEDIARYRWHLTVAGYPGRKEGSSRVLMHNQIMGKIPGLHIDHIDRNPLDCRRKNLRRCTATQNAQNRGKLKGVSSEFKGVSWHIEKKCWQACICVNYKLKHLGYFRNEEEAALTYDNMAQELFGEFAVLNFPDTERISL